MESNAVAFPLSRAPMLIRFLQFIMASSALIEASDALKLLSCYARFGYCMCWVEPPPTSTGILGIYKDPNMITITSCGH